MTSFDKQVAFIKAKIPVYYKEVVIYSTVHFQILLKDKLKHSIAFNNGAL